MTIIKNMNLSKKLILINLLLITLPTLVFACVLYSVQSHQLYKQMLQERRSAIEQLSNSLDTSLTSVEDLSQSLVYRSTISALVTRSDLNMYPTWSKYNSEEILIDLKYSLKYQNLGLKDASIYTNNPDIPELNSFHDISTLYHLPFYQDFRNSQKSFDFYLLSSEDTQSFYQAKGDDPHTPSRLMVFVQKIQPDFASGYSGVLIFEADPQKFFSSLSVYENASSGYFIYFHNLNNFYGCIPEKDVEEQLTSSTYQNSELQSATTSVLSQTLSHYPATVVSQSPLNQNTYAFPAFKLSFFLIAITILQCIALQLVTSNIFKRINSNITEMDEIIANEFSGKITVDSSDEIGFIAQRYNTLLDKIDTLIEDTILKETDAKNAQIKALQFQMNPHFIYNTLSIFAGNAQQNGNFELADAISYFGHLLRYNVKDTGLYSTVELELENTRSLIKVYSMKFIGKLELKINVDDGLLERKLIKFLLQPIIENSIFHGTSGITSNMTIILNIWEDGRTLKLQIIDDGIGIEETYLKQIQENILYGTPLTQTPKSNSSFIGLHNVYERIQLIYGMDATLSIQSTYGKGTQVLVCLPLSQESGGKKDEI